MLQSQQSGKTPEGRWFGCQPTLIPSPKSCKHFIFSAAVQTASSDDSYFKVLVRILQSRLGRVPPVARGCPPRTPAARSIPSTPHSTGYMSLAGGRIGLRRGQAARGIPDWTLRGVASRTASCFVEDYPPTAKSSRNLNWRTVSTADVFAGLTRRIAASALSPW